MILIARIKCVVFIKNVIYMCFIHSYKWKRLQYAIISNFIVRQKLKTVQIQMEEQQLNMLFIQKEILRNASLNYC